MKEFFFEVKSFRELDLDELYDLLVLRNLVFVVGQKITAEAEVDGQDRECLHAILRVGGVIVGTARIESKEEYFKVGRVCVTPGRQGEGLGTELMKGIQYFLGEQRAALHAQAHLQAWYERLGWIRVGEEFQEAEIPHVKMRWGSGWN